MISESIGKIVGLILTHSVLIGSALQEGELLVPVVIYYQDGIRKIESFEAETQNEAVHRGLEFINSMPDNVEAWAYVQDGLITLDNGQKQDVYFFKAWVKGMSAPLELYQMYQYQPFELIDNIKILNFESTGLSMQDADVFSSALTEGLYLHPSATKEQVQRWF